MSSDRRPLWQPFSEPATDTAAQPPSGARLLAVERAPFLEPAAKAAETPATPASRRPLGCGGLAPAVVPDGRH
ncbi:hypothetical protein SAMN05216371_8182 [Streptomyces sp. TLI_053]|uniref:hypothetical protein n=1 Tax=Streptomyces sp. TLI_053 TaxID=1855352 RepID=UPI00087B4375|nr:hypothetical protein [Streptomyces sp. TLI_053]SDT83361.1 hypothetical protein SAMN05216371_8182 [Streptomyces sp. TLI_053]